MIAFCDGCGCDYAATNDYCPHHGQESYNQLAAIGRPVVTFRNCTCCGCQIDEEQASLGSVSLCQECRDYFTAQNQKC